MSVLANVATQRAWRQTLTGNQRLTLLIAILIAVAMVAGGVTFKLLYDAAFAEQSRNLVRLVKSQANLIDGISRFDRVQSQDAHPKGWKYATLGQVVDAHIANDGLGRTGEITIGAPLDGKVVFVFRSRGDEPTHALSIPPGSELGEPMRRALSGLSGNVVGPDYGGVTVLAAYEPLRELQWGIVAKISIAEVREPLIRTGFISGIAAVIVIIFGTLLFQRMIDPLITRLEEQVRWRTETLETEIEERQRIEAALAESEKMYRTLIETSYEGIWMGDMEGRTTYANQRLADMLGYEVDEMIGMSIYEARDESDHERVREIYLRRLLGTREIVEHRLRRKDGQEIYVLNSAAPIYDDDGKVIGGFAMVTDITERKKAQDEIEQLANHDSLTGLPSRRLAFDRIATAFAAARRGKNLAALLYIDLDGFKVINDHHGHEAGDFILREVAKRLPALVREVDTTARLGGDEFLVLVAQLHDVSAAETIAQKVIDALSVPIEFKGLRLQIGASIGIAVYDGGPDSPEDVLNRADRAMYIVKHGSKNGYVVAERRTHATSHWLDRTRRVQSRSIS